MVINPNFHLSRKFISRKPGYDIAVVLDLSSPQIFRYPSTIREMGKRYRTIYFVERDHVWSRIIEDYAPNSRSPIFLLDFREDEVPIKLLQNLSQLEADLRLISMFRV